ncbi:MAG: hypothetical protein WEB57_05920 [Pseudohongiellaceae bacterium]
MIRSLLTITLAGLMMTGCLFVVDSKERSHGEQWSRAEADRIERGATSAGWIRASFGEPDRRITYEDGTELWRYSNRRTRDSEVSLFLLFNIDIERDNTETLTLEIRDGVVTDHWVEKR